IFPVILTELKVNNKPIIVSENSSILDKHISVADKIDLSYKQDFSISYTALNFTNPQENEYAYMLEGYDSGWNHVGSIQTASYTNLSPGEYVFRVKTHIYDGMMNSNGYSIKIIVHPPFWMTPIAYLIYFLVFVAFMLFLRHLEVKRTERKFQREQDVLNAKQLFEQEKREVKQRHDLDKMKIKFLQNLSHELRTPISLIMAPVDKILNDEESGNVKNNAFAIKRNAKRLLNLVNQLLDFRQIEERESTLNLKKEEFVSFLGELVNSFRDLSDNRKVQLVYTSEVDEFYTYFDTEKIERILFNLLSNAFKFTKEDGIVKVELKYNKNHTSIEDKKWFTINVINNGLAIPKEHHESIFSRSFRRDVTSSLNEGTGIGLSITKEFVELHGGSIRVESEEGKETIFTIEIPLIPAEPTEKEIKKLNLQETHSLDSLASGNQNDAVNGAEKPKILIVEDNEEFRYYLKESLKVNYKVVEAANGIEGWKEALSHHPELVVSDINMPFMSGIELTNKIKSDKRTSHIPIILLTALAGEEALLNGLEMGANDYITKPVNFDILNIKIGNVLKLNQKLKETYTKQVKILTTESEPYSENENFLNKVVLYIEDNLTDTQLSVENLSKHMNMSRSTFYHKILEVTGNTPIEFIRNLKLEKALALLESSDMNVAQISYCVGFATPNYFSKSFKAKYNMLPSEYINKKRNVLV
ncbi:MAG TPA: hybrid sensor histidine kinase/response regulator transcription factor, partial [Sphingobacteriaceae bacterium]|nr:hybrid sensor histidine kinase/response regulator transcription factor [Sphingobacteriaceae bacterium]